MFQAQHLILRSYFKSISFKKKGKKAFWYGGLSLGWYSYQSCLALTIFFLLSQQLTLLTINFLWIASCSSKTANSSIQLHLFCEQLIKENHWRTFKESRSYLFSPFSRGTPEVRGTGAVGKILVPVLLTPAPASSLTPLTCSSLVVSDVFGRMTLPAHNGFSWINLETWELSSFYFKRYLWGQRRGESSQHITKGIYCSVYAGFYFPAYMKGK